MDGLKHIEAAEYKHSAASETRAINAVEIKLRDIGIENDEIVMICDTPGFGKYLHSHIAFPSFLTMSVILLLQGIRKVQQWISRMASVSLPP